MGNDGSDPTHYHMYNYVYVPTHYHMYNYYVSDPTDYDNDVSYPTHYHMYNDVSDPTHYHLYNDVSDPTHYNMYNDVSDTTSPYITLTKNSGKNISNKYPPIPRNTSENKSQATWLPLGQIQPLSATGASQQDIRGIGKVKQC